jgi:small nuclear ribonucleoprotein (snRNP)-like protein
MTDNIDPGITTNTEILVAMVEAVDAVANAMLELTRSLERMASAQEAIAELANRTYLNGTNVR